MNEMEKRKIEQEKREEIKKSSTTYDTVIKILNSC